MGSPSSCSKTRSTRRSGPLAWSGLRRSALQSNETMMSETSNATISVNGESEPLAVATIAALLQERAVDVEQRGIAVALNGAVVPRASWAATALKPGDTIEIVRARQGG